MSNSRTAARLGDLAGIQSLPADQEAVLQGLPGVVAGPRGRGGPAWWTTERSRRRLAGYDARQ